MNSLRYIYNLGIAEDFRSGLTDGQLYQKKFKANKALKKHLEVYSKQVSYLESFIKANQENLFRYKDCLIGLCLSLLQQNSQSRDYKLDKLTGYGEKLNLIRRDVYANQNTEKGFMGTLLYHSTPDSLDSALDIVESSLVNLWEYLEVDIALTPAERYTTLLTNLGVTISVEDLGYEVLDSFGNAEVKLYAKENLISREDFNKFQYKFLTLELSNDLLNFMTYGQELELYSINTTQVIQNLINFNQVGSLVLVYQAFMVEGLLLAARYLENLDYEIKQLSFSEFCKSSNFNQREQLANYLALSFDAANSLREVFISAPTWAVRLFNEVQSLMTTTIPKEGDYRLNG